MIRKVPEHPRALEHIRMTICIRADSPRGHAMGKGAPNFTILPDAAAVARAAAERLLARLAESRERFAVCLTGGSSPEGLYRRLGGEAFPSPAPGGGAHLVRGGRAGG